MKSLNLIYLLSCIYHFFRTYVFCMWANSYQTLWYKITPWHYYNILNSKYKHVARRDTTMQWIQRGFLIMLFVIGNILHAKSPDDSKKNLLLSISFKLIFYYSSLQNINARQKKSSCKVTCQLHVIYESNTCL